MGYSDLIPLSYGIENPALKEIIVSVYPVDAYLKKKVDIILFIGPQPGRSPVSGFSLMRSRFIIGLLATTQEVVIFNLLLTTTTTSCLIEFLPLLMVAVSFGLYEETP